MKHFQSIILIALTTMLASFKPADKSPFDSYPVYPGNDLGVKYSPLKTTFKVWAPKAAEVKLRIYDGGEGGQAISTISMTKGPNGTWLTVINKDIKNKYY